MPTSRVLRRQTKMGQDSREARAVDYVQGSCLIVRRETIERVGLLDEAFFMYFEEVDWCWRIEEAGGKVFYCPMGSIIHYSTNVLGHYDEWRLVHYYRGLFRFYQKHHSEGRTFILRALIALRSFIRVAGWSAVAIARPRLRSRAHSSMRGNMRTLGAVLRGNP